jgi:Tfp pilus assembly protein PilE
MTGLGTRAGTDPLDDTPTTAGGGSGGSVLRWGLAAFLVVVVAVAAVLVVLEISSLRPRTAENRAAEQQRSAVVRAAERFTVQVNTYDAASMDAYQRSMSTMMSPKFRTDYKKVTDQLAATIKQAKVTSKGVVLASAVASLDADSAQVLVVSDASVRTIYDPNLARHFRWEVSLVRIGGRWLVDDFTPVA